MIKQLCRISIYLVGYIILSLGQRLFVVANLGAASLDAVCIGLAKMTNLSAGMWVNITGIILILISAILRKSYPNFLALISTITFGLFFDLWGLILNNINIGTSVMAQFGIYSLAIILAPLGTAIYFISDFPKSAVDDFLIAIKDFFNIKIGLAKTFCEALFCTIAFIVSGPIGLTTIVTAFLFGPILQFYYVRLTVHNKYNKNKRNWSEKSVFAKWK